MLKITADAYERMMAYTFLTDKEITAFMFSEDRDDDHVIYDLSLPIQVVTDTSADVTDEAAWYESLTVQQRKDLHGWMHSHNTMPPFASGDDEKSIVGMLAIMSWCITIITNHMNEFYVRIDQTVPVPMMLKDVPLIVVPDARVMKELRKEVKEKVTEKEWKRGSHPIYEPPHHQREVSYGLQDYFTIDPNARTETVGDDDDGSGLLEGGGDDRALSMMELYSRHE